LVSWYRNIGLELLECYGMAENFAYSHTSRPKGTRVGYVGACNPGVGCRIAANGEIHIKSPTQMMGYFKEPVKTAEVMTPDGYFKTGDRGEIDEQGRLKITGRVKDLFKTAKGKYVVPAPIEDYLAGHPKIEAACVVGSSQPQPFALITLSPEALNGSPESTTQVALTHEMEALLDNLNATLEGHEALDYLVIVKDQWTVDNGLLTPTMKIKRHTIEQVYLNYGDSWLATGKKVIWAAKALV